jgi:hypothetical protein
MRLRRCSPCQCTGPAFARPCPPFNLYFNLQDGATLLFPWVYTTNMKGGDEHPTGRARRPPVWKGRREGRRGKACPAHAAAIPPLFHCSAALTATPSETALSVAACLHGHSLVHSLTHLHVCTPILTHSLTPSLSSHNHSLLYHSLRSPSQQPA